MDHINIFIYNKKINVLKLLIVIMTLSKVFFFSSLHLYKAKNYTIYFYHWNLLWLFWFLSKSVQLVFFIFFFNVHHYFHIYDHCEICVLLYDKITHPSRFCYSLFLCCLFKVQHSLPVL